MKIEFGCGEKPSRNGFLTCDVRDLPNVDFVCNAWDIGYHVEPESVDNIYSRHFFEHLTFEQGEVFLLEIYKILKKGGVVEMSLPNMNYHLLQYIFRRHLKHARAGFWGWQRGGINETWDIHKSGYNYTELLSLVSKLGFVKCSRVTGHAFSKHLHVRFEK